MKLFLLILVEKLKPIGEFPIQKEVLKLQKWSGFFFLGWEKTNTPTIFSFFSIVSHAIHYILLKQNGKSFEVLLENKALESKWDLKRMIKKREKRHHAKSLNITIVFNYQLKWVKDHTMEKSTHFPYKLCKLLLEVWEENTKYSFCGIQERIYAHGSWMEGTAFTVFIILSKRNPVTNVNKMKTFY